jgi:hypothetical protein
MTRKKASDEPPFRIMSDPAEVPALESAWSATAGVACFTCQSFNDYVAQAGSGALRIVVAPDGTPILPLIRESVAHKLTVGERRIGQIRFTALRIVNPWLAEGMQPVCIGSALQYALTSERVDAVAVQDVPDESIMQAALRFVKWPALHREMGRKRSLRWLIDLPDTFDQYLALLSSSTRQSVKRKLRALGKEFSVDITLVKDATEIDDFIAKGEAISRLTYQWHVGQRLVNDEATRSRYRQLAEQGRLRCYLMSLDGVPRAFLRGTLDGDRKSVV